MNFTLQTEVVIDEDDAAKAPESAKQAYISRGGATNLVEDEEKSPSTVCQSARRQM